MDPNSKIVLLDKGNELFTKKDYNNAMRYYEYAIKVDPEIKSVLLRKGNDLFQ